MDMDLISTTTTIMKDLMIGAITITRLIKWHILIQTVRDDKILIKKNSVNELSLNLERDA